MGLNPFLGLFSQKLVFQGQGGPKLKDFLIFVDIHPHIDPVDPDQPTSTLVWPHPQKGTHLIQHVFGGFHTNGGRFCVCGYSSAYVLLLHTAVQWFSGYHLVFFPVRGGFGCYRSIPPVESLIISKVLLNNTVVVTPSPFLQPLLSIEPTTLGPPV